MDHGKVALNIPAVLSLPMELNCVWEIVKQNIIALIHFNITK